MVTLPIPDLPASRAAQLISAHWPLFRYNPDLVAQGKNPFQLDSRPATIGLKDYIYNETRYTMLAKSNPEHAQELFKLAQEDVAAKWKLYEHMSHQTGAPVEEVTKLSTCPKLSTFPRRTWG